MRRVALADPRDESKRSTTTWALGPPASAVLGSTGWLLTQGPTGGAHPCPRAGGGLLPAPPKRAPGGVGLRSASEDRIRDSGPHQRTASGLGGDHLGRIPQRLGCFAPTRTFEGLLEDIDGAGTEALPYSSGPGSPSAHLLMEVSSPSQTRSPGGMQGSCSGAFSRTNALRNCPCCVLVFAGIQRFLRPQPSLPEGFARALFSLTPIGSCARSA